MNIYEKFMVAFEGFNAAHGQTKISEERRAGKQKAHSYIVRQPLTLSLVEGHINGFKGVGSIPINEHNKCKFGALDIDEYPLDHNALVDKLEELKVPCIVCRSKSGGAHIFFFFTKWMEAADFRDKAAEIAAALGHGRCEIFPKQEQVLVERGDVGNFINLPYFDAHKTLRFAYWKEGPVYIEATLQEFVERIHKIKCDPNKFMELSVGGKPNLFPGFVPCLRAMLSVGVHEGGRNKVAFQLGVFLQKSTPNDWKSQLEQLNVKHFTPPLPAAEIVTIQSQLEKKEYQYLCKDEPMSSHCNQGVCRGLKHGIGTTSMPAISGLSVILSEPRLWFLDIDGRRLELTTEELQTPRLFQRACMEQLNFMPPKMKDGDWEIQVNGLLENCNEIAVPQELTYKGQFLSYLELFCTGRVQAQSFEEVVLGKPYTDGEEARTYFKIDSLMEFLRNRKFDNYTRAQVQERLKEINNGDSSLVKKFQNSQGKWKSVRVWWIPEFGGEVEIKPITIETDEVPF